MRSNLSKLPVPALAWLIIPLVWLIARPYFGIRHDATLYMGQALRQIWPDIFSRDIFFAHGSQDSFSVFALLTASLFKTIGVVAVESLVPLAAHAAILWFALHLVRTENAFTEFEAWLALVSIAAFPHLYDAASIFAFAEPFLTARTLAEPLCLLAICLLIHQRWTGATVAMLIAGAVHPLITAPILIIAWTYLSLSDRRWLWAASLMLAPVVMGWLAVPPFDMLFLQYDPVWWSHVEEKNVNVLITHWELPGWQTLVFDLFVLGLASRVLEGKLSRLCIATAVTVTLLLVISATGADLLHNVLITSLQLWRVMWFGHLLMLLMLPLLIVRFWREGPLGPVVASALFLAAVASRWSAGWAFIAWAILAVFLQRKEAKISPRYVNAVTGASLVGAIAVCIVIGLYGAEAASHRDGASALSVGLAFATTPLAMFIVAIALLFSLRWSPPIQPIAWAILAAVAAIGVTNWDRRDSWQRFVESSLDADHPFQKFIGPHQQVYWHDQLQGSWLLLKRPNYYSEIQGAGQLFNRGTMQDFSRREPEFKGLRLQESLCKMMSGMDGGGIDKSCSPTLDLVEEICLKQPSLDYMVFELKLMRGVVAEWTFNPMSHQKPTTYYLYDCNKFRKG